MQPDCNAGMRVFTEKIKVTHKTTHTYQGTLGDPLEDPQGVPPKALWGRGGTLGGSWAAWNCNDGGGISLPGGLRREILWPMDGSG